MSQHRLSLVHRPQQQQQQQPRVVLPEEEYQRNLSEVIQRQFFPDLPDLQAQALAQQKREAGDYAGAESVQRAAELLRVHDERVRQAEQQEEEGTTDGGLYSESDEGGGGPRALLRSKPRPLHLETLTGFHARVTSEDNADFETAQDEEIRRNQIERSKLLMLTNQGATTNTVPPPPRLTHGGATPLLFLASDAFDAPPDATRPGRKDAPVENGFFFVPSASANAREETGEPPHDQTEDSNQRLLMPPPNVPTTAAPKSNQLVSDRVSLTATVPLANALVEYLPKRHLEKRIEPANTRFPGPSQSMMISSSSSSRPGTAPRHLEGDTTDEESSRGGGGSTTLAGDSDTDLDRDSVDGSSVGSVRLDELRRQARKRKEREWQRLVPLSPSAQTGNDLRTDDLSSLSLLPASSFQLPPTLPREVVAERAHELAQERSKRAGQHVPSSSSSVASASRGSRQRPSSSSSSKSIAGAQSVRSIFSASSRPASSARSRSALGTALRSAYGARPTSVLVGSPGVDNVRGASSKRHSSTSSSSVRSRSSRQGR